MSKDETLHSQFQAERKYYLGYTDTVPGTNKKVAVVRKEYLAGVAEEDARMAKRQADFFAKRNAETSNTQTTAVTAGVVRDYTIDTGTPTPLGITTPDEPAKPLTKEELVKLGKDDLVAMAKESGIETVPDSMTKDTIADLILAR